MFRIGFGYDIHRFKKGRPLMLGGIRIPFEKGLDGHSDADVVLHALIDALLGAAGLPDIGHYFPPGKADTKNISSLRMLAKAVLEIEKQGYRLGNADIALIAEAPRVAPYRELMRQTMARALKAPPSAVQVKGKTHEGMDSLGRGEGLAAYAVVLLERIRE